MKKIIKNFIYQASYQVLLILLPVITVPIISKALGPRGIGEWNYVNSIVNYFVLLAGLGLANYAVREIAFSNSSKYELSRKFWEIQLFNLSFSGVVLIFYLIFCFFTPYKYLFLIQGFIVASTTLDISWFFQGIEDFKKVAIRNFFIKIISFFLILFFVKEGTDIYKYGLIVSISQFLSIFILWASLKDYIVWTKVSYKEIFSHFFPALNFFILKISATIFNNLNRTLLGILGSIISVGYFSNSITLVVMVSSIVGSINIVLLPYMSSLEKKEDFNKSDEIIERVIDFQLFITIGITFGIIVISNKMIPWFFGERFAILKFLVPILAPVVIFQQMHQSIANLYLVPKNRMKEYNVSMLFGTVINIVLCIILIPIIDVYGAAISYLAGQATICTFRTVTLIRSTSINIKIINIVVYLFSGIVMVVFTDIVTQGMSPNIFTTVVQIIFGSIVYMISLTILKKNPLLIYLRNRK